MKFNIKESFNDFLNNSKDYPILAGFSVGFYGMVFYFSNNFDLVNSWKQTLFFFFNYIVFSVAIFFILSKIIQKTKWFCFFSQAIFIVMIVILPIYLFGISNLLGSYKKMGLILILILVLLIFKIKNYIPLRLAFRTLSFCSFVKLKLYFKTALSQSPYMGVGKTIKRLPN